MAIVGRQQKGFEGIGRALIQPYLVYIHGRYIFLNSTNGLYHQYCDGTCFCRFNRFGIIKNYAFMKSRWSGRYWAIFALSLYLTFYQPLLSLRIFGNDDYHF